MRQFGLSGVGRVTAYVLAADPNFLRESISAYYGAVDRIVVSYDRAATSWTGTPLPVAQCLEIIRSVDVDGKCVGLAGDYARLEHDPLDNDTFQRQEALDAASEGADWVLQLDSDEVMVAPQRFFAALSRAAATGAGGLDYPSRWLYTRVRPTRYLERARRFGRIAASYPGPLALRAGTRLMHARQADVPLYRVDFARRSTDPARPRSAPVHEVVGAGEGVLHFSWVRNPQAMRRKFGWSGHAAELAPPKIYRDWLWRSRHPVYAAWSSMLRQNPDEWYRRVSIPEPPGGDPLSLTTEAASLKRDGDEA